MTQTFAINDQNDIYLGNNGNLVIFSGLPAVTQACQTATQAQLGEMVLETGKGIPNFQAVWVGTPNYALWSSYVLATLNAIDGVNEVTSLQVKTANNMLTYIAVIASEYGPAEIIGG